jgi:hypothetical protein
MALPFLFHQEADSLTNPAVITLPLKIAEMIRISERATKDRGNI